MVKKIRVKTHKRKLSNGKLVNVKSHVRNIKKRSRYGNMSFLNSMKNTSYYCNKCKEWHYFGTDIGNSHVMYASDMVKSLIKNDNISYKMSLKGFKFGEHFRSEEKDEMNEYVYFVRHVRNIPAEIKKHVYSNGEPYWVVYIKKKKEVR